MDIKEKKKFLLDYINGLNPTIFDSFIESLYNIIKFNSYGKTFRNICILSDSEYGYHVYINDFKKDISFGTDSENLLFIINSIVKEVGLYE